MKKKSNFINCIILLFILPFLFADEFNSSWRNSSDARWIGENFWANRLQDWLIKDGKLLCVEKRTSYKMRTVHLLTHNILDKGDFSSNITIHNNENTTIKTASAGFLVGAGENKISYQKAALIHQGATKTGGYFCGISNTGKVFITPFNRTMNIPSEGNKLGNKIIELKLTSKEVDDKIILTLNAYHKNALISTVSKTIKSNKIQGNIAIVSHSGNSKKIDLKFDGHGFSKWHLSGTRIKEFKERTLGPIVSCQYTVSKNVLNLTAQLMPVDKGNVAVLQVYKDDKWIDIQEQEILNHSFIAKFQVKDWDSSKKVNYRVKYKTSFFAGIIQKDPKKSEEFTLGALTCNHNNSHSIFTDWSNTVWFPHDDLMENLIEHKPDLLFFSGDQLYEGRSPSRVDVQNLKLDYMYKWYLFCWAYSPYLKDIPSVIIPDDHDVYQGNLWGENGRKASNQNDGGYVFDKDFINMVHETQTSNLPDPVDPKRVTQNIKVYFTDLVYGDISFAILEDRKFKSGCKRPNMPKSNTNRPDHFSNVDFNMMKLDLDGLELLGKRQEDFLTNWVEDWQNHKMKVALSQTIFAGVATHHGGGLARVHADLDSNGWPQSGRNRALEILRKGFAIHIAGDQHLASLVQHGIDNHKDSIYSFSVPAIANFYPRKWMPEEEGKNKPLNSPSWMGDHLDGFTNKISVYAVANPGKKSGREPARLHDSMAGYGIIKLNKNTRKIVFECWPRYAKKGVDSQYKYWPMTINQTDNFAKKAYGFLPEIKLDKKNMICKVYDSSNSLVYALSLKEKSFTPKVFKHDTYKIVLVDPVDNSQKILENLKVEKVLEAK